MKYMSKVGSSVFLLPFGGWGEGSSFPFNNSLKFLSIQKFILSTLNALVTFISVLSAISTFRVSLLIFRHSALRIFVLEQHFWFTSINFSHIFCAFFILGYNNLVVRHKVKYCLVQTFLTKQQMKALYGHHACPTFRPSPGISVQDFSVKILCENSSQKLQNKLQFRGGKKLSQ